MRDVHQTNTYAWFREHVEDISQRAAYSPHDRTAAFDALTREGALPLGIIYREERPTFEDRTGLPSRPIVHLDIAGPQSKIRVLAERYR